MTVIDNQAIATAINAPGEVTGFFSKSSGYGAFLYSRGKVRDLGNLPDATGMRAFAINNQGHIAGEADFPTTPPFNIINSPLALWTGARWRNLGAVPGDLVEAFPFSINAFDEIVGFSVFPGGFRAFLWNGAFTALPCVPGAFCEAMGINDDGTIVGQASNGSTLIWTGGGMFDLAASIDPRDPLKGQVDLFGGGITGINNRGTIAADGQYQSGSKLGQVDVFLLTPVEKIANR
jgi:probable HAF family extracellular repeat protein